MTSKKRMSKSTLKALVNQLNDSAGMNRRAYTKDERGHYQPNPGTYTLDWAYGGVRLAQMCEGGGQRDLTPRGNMRETYNAIQWLLLG